MRYTKVYFLPLPQITRTLGIQEGEFGMDYKDLPGAEYIRFEKGDYIIQAGEPAKYFYVLTTGSARRIKIGENGSEMIMFNYEKNDIACAITAYYNILPVSSIIAVTTTYAWRIPRDIFLQEMEKDTKLMKHMLDQLAKEYLDVVLRFRLVREGKSSDILCNTLLSLAYRDESNTLRVDKIYTNTRLAKYLGIHAVTATRIINQLQKENIIVRTKQGLQIIDEAQLRRYAEGLDSLKYQ